jgi:hypothetical protein
MRRILAIVILILLSFSALAQRDGVKGRWTIKELEEESKALQWNSENEICFWGEYRKMTYTTLDSVYVNNVIFKKQYLTCPEAKCDYKRLRDRMMLLPNATEVWVVSKWTMVIYFGNYGVYLDRNYDTVTIEFLPFFGD